MKARRSGFHGLYVLLLTLVAVGGSTAYRTCYVFLRLKINNEVIDKDIPDYKIGGWVTHCDEAKKKCSAIEAEKHLENLYGSALRPLSSPAADNLCKLFDRDILYSDGARLQLLVKASNCESHFYVRELGRLCCWKCVIDKCPTIVYSKLCDLERPFWCSVPSDKSK